ncbi:hypothetical protein KBA73_01685 [Patescibacteria group bacterium]|nr:hypothetical protein [Patescibacteria group bacterium]
MREDLAKPLNDAERKSTLERLLLARLEKKIELEKAQTALKSAVYFCNLAASDVLASVEELRSRLNPIFTQAGGDNRLMKQDRSEPIFDKDGRYIYQSNLPTGLTPLSKSLEPLFEPIVQFQCDVPQRSQETKKRIKSIQYFRNLIQQSVIGSMEELRSRLNPIFTQAGGDNRLMKQDRSEPIYDKDGRYIYQSNLPVDRSLPDEEKKLIIEYYTLTEDKSVPDEVRANIKRYFESKDVASKSRIRTSIAANQRDSALLERFERLTSTFDEIDRKDALNDAFYNLIGKAGTAVQAQALLVNYEQRSDEDRALIQELIGKISIRRRQDALTAVVAVLQKSPLDVEKALQTIAFLGTGGLPDDRALARELTEVVYRLELAQSDVKVTSQITLNADPRQVFIGLNGLPTRPTVDKIEYVERYQALRKLAEPTFVQFQQVLRRKRVNEIRRSFSVRGKTPEAVLESIKALPLETQEDIATQKQLVDLYRIYLSAEQPAEFDRVFKQGIADQLDLELKEKFVSPELGKNKEAFHYMRERFRETLYLLGESFRDDPRTKEAMEAYLRPKVVNGVRTQTAQLYVQSLKELQKQRPLTDIERMYIESVELLSLFNPYLLAIVTADMGATQEFLRHHFENVSTKTARELKEGDYVPAIQLGLGPQGIVAQGEIVRNAPTLAASMLVVDDGDVPGGPFAIPNGPAWELNSANSAGAITPSMPNAPVDELKTIRAYGSPVARWYPGERQEGNDVRQGSINTTVDYLITPDQLSTARYPTNEEMALVITMQAAILTKKVAFRTRILRVKPNPNPNEKGDTIVTVEIEQADGSNRIVNLKTDAVINGSGLGGINYGFELKNSRAEKVIEQTKGSKKFPRLSPTLEAFNAFADRSKVKESPGSTMVIYGGGNSADTLIELIGRIFQGDNPAVRNVTKLYIVTKTNLSSRPRYSLISDLKPRNGRGNLIEIINERVIDVGFATEEGKPEDRPLLVYGANGKPLTNGGGKPILADSVIAAAGFKPRLDEVYAAYLTGPNQSFRQQDEGPNSPVEPIVLPTAPEIPVADQMKGHPNILFIGTSSNARFQGIPKLAQLPIEAREALLRNGAENAVAIGFRGPDTQAAINIWINSRNITLESPENVKDLLSISANGFVAMGEKARIPLLLDEDNQRIPNNITSETLLLSPLIAYEIGNAIRLENEVNSEGYTGDFQFEVTFNEQRQEFSLEFLKGDLLEISRPFFEAVQETIRDEFTQRYILSALRKRRRSPKIELNFSFKKGRIDPRNTYVQEG